MESKNLFNADDKRIPYKIKASQYTVWVKTF